MDVLRVHGSFDSRSKADDKLETLKMCCEFRCPEYEETASNVHFVEVRFKHVLLQLNVGFAVSFVAVPFVKIEKTRNLLVGTVCYVIH